MLPLEVGVIRFIDIKRRNAEFSSIDVKKQRTKSRINLKIENHRNENKEAENNLAKTCYSSPQQRISNYQSQLSYKLITIHLLGLENSIHISNIPIT